MEDDNKRIKYIAYDIALQRDLVRRPSTQETWLYGTRQGIEVEGQKWDYLVTAGPRPREIGQRVDLVVPVYLVHNSPSGQELQRRVEQGNSLISVFDPDKAPKDSLTFTASWIDPRTKALHSMATNTIGINTEKDEGMAWTTELHKERITENFQLER